MLLIFIRRPVYWALWLLW